MNHFPSSDRPVAPLAESADPALKHALIQALTQQDPGVDPDLEARIMTQWRAGPGRNLVPHKGAAPVMALGWRARWRPMLWGALAALALGFAWWAHQGDTLSDDDLSQPDVLSLISAGEL